MLKRVWDRLKPLGKERKFQRDLDNLNALFYLADFELNHCGDEMKLHSAVANIKPPYLEFSVHRFLNSQISQIFYDKYTPVDYDLEIKTSGIKGAGQGVFVKHGRLRRGSVCAIYPGMVLLPSDFATLSGKRDKRRQRRVDGGDSMYLFQRTDGIIINAYQFKEQVIPRFSGHMINHPPKGKIPNVMAVPFNFSRKETFGEEAKVLEQYFDFLNTPFEDKEVENIFRELRARLLESFSVFPEHLKDEIPHKYFEKHNQVLSFLELGKHAHAKIENMYYPSVAILTTQDISKDKELLIDYRFNPRFPNLPSWYHPVDEETDLRRWSVG